MKNNILRGLDSQPRASLPYNLNIDRQDAIGPPDTIPNLQTEQHSLDNRKSIAESKNSCDQSILPCQSMIPFIKPLVQIKKYR